MANPITLTNPHDSTVWACEAHPGWPLHIIGECERLAGVKPYNMPVSCSRCWLPWGSGLISQHAGCAHTTRDGRRVSAYPVTQVTVNGDWAVVDYV